jgi:hypothetical protein
MFRSKSLRVLAMLAAGAVLCLAGEAFAQPGGGNGGGGGGRGGRMGGRGNFDANAMRAQAAARLKEALGCTDEELAVFQPKVEKVQQLQRDSRGGFGGMGGMMGGRGGPGGPGGPGGADRPQSEVQKKMAALQTLLQNKESSADDVKAALKALRDARAEAQKALQAAQQELKALCTVKQEAYFVTAGVLE